GHGALFALDPRACNPPCPVTVLSDGRIHPTMPWVTGTAFEDPVGVAYDRVRSVLYVADLSADGLRLGSPGAVFAVDLTTGEVGLVSAGPCTGAGCLDFSALTAIAVRPDGMIVVADGIQGSSIIWLID